MAEDRKCGHCETGIISPQNKVSDRCRACSRANTVASRKRWWREMRKDPVRAAEFRERNKLGMRAARAHRKRRAELAAKAAEVDSAEKV